MKKIFFILTFLGSFLFCSDVFVEVQNIKKECKTIKIGLYNSKENFTNVDKAYKGVTLQVDTSQIKHTFSDIPNGTYAIALFCDKNQNGVHDTNFFGIPKEAYGFSNNPQGFGKPEFEDANFELKKIKKIMIYMQK